MTPNKKNSIIIIGMMLAIVLAIFSYGYVQRVIGTQNDSTSPQANVTNTSILPISNQISLDSLKSRDPLRIIALGNWDCTNQTRTVVKEIQSRNPDLVVGLGDYSYSENNKCFFDMVAPIEDKMKLSMGDEEKKQINAREVFLEHFLLPGEFYSFDAVRIHFLMLSSEIPSDPDTSQYIFAKNDLARAASNPNTDWIVVVVHKPMYTSPSLYPALGSLRELYHPLFEEYGVDLVMQAHNSNYQRTYPLLFNARDPANPVIVSNTTGQADGQQQQQYVESNGTIFLTVGTAGHEPLDKLTATSYFATFQNDTNHGFLEMDISSSSSGGATNNSTSDSTNGQGLTNINQQNRTSGSGTETTVAPSANVTRLEAAFYGNSGNNDELKILDSFSIEKKE